MPVAQSSSYNKVASYETPELFAGLGHAQVPEFYNLSMSITDWVMDSGNNTNMMTYNHENIYNLEDIAIYPTMYGQDTLGDIRSMSQSG